MEAQTSILDFLVFNTETGAIYAYLIGDEKKKILYNNGSHYFVKAKGRNIIFRSNKDIERINNFINF